MEDCIKLAITSIDVAIFPLAIMLLKNNCSFIIPILGSEGKVNSNKAY
jgi:hypothetical protein